jgi:hypothetical protein
MRRDADASVMTVTPRVEPRGDALVPKPPVPKLLLGNALVPKELVAGRFAETKQDVWIHRTA